MYSTYEFILPINKVFKEKNQERRKVQDSGKFLDLFGVLKLHITRGEEGTVLKGGGTFD